MSKKKLCLKSETVRTLSASELDAIAFGAAGEAGCVGSCVPGCPRPGDTVKSALLGNCQSQQILRCDGGNSQRLFHCNPPSGVICVGAKK